MKIRVLALVSASVVSVLSVRAEAAEQDAKHLVKAAPVPSLYNWSGFYAGMNVGAAWSAYDLTTSAMFAGPGGYLSSPQISVVNAAGVQSISSTGFTGGVQAGYNWQRAALVLGLESDINYLHLNGAANSGFVAYPTAPLSAGFVVSAYAHNDWLFTLRPRLGVAQNNWLFYVTGGLALTQMHDNFLFVDNRLLQAAEDVSTKVGWIAGGGFEWAFGNKLSMRAEYLHVNFDRTGAGVSLPGRIQQPLIVPFNQSSKLSSDLARVGLNYHFNAPDVSATASVKTGSVEHSPWEFDVGSRLFFSTGAVGAANPLLNAPPEILASRLIYSGLNGISGETFARADHAGGFFVKGFLGAGDINRGSLNDEDFFSPYSNTLLSAIGHLAYANGDVGYTFLKSPGAKIGAFVGYNYYTQHINTFGCSQLAGSDICRPGFSDNFLGIANDHRFNSMRIGLTSEFMLTDRLKFTAEAAYLPWVDFKGQDDHNARKLLLPQASSTGNGVMLEGILGYKITDNWNVGIGGRYWAWNMKDGTVDFNFLDRPGTKIVEPGRFNAERYGLFLQTDYHWGDTTAAIAAPSLPVKGTVTPSPMSWSGIYVGGHLGGGFSNDHWSDPFGSTPGYAEGSFNIAGFGDKIHTTGPLAGGQIGVNWQNEQWVFGLEAAGSWLNLRGENSCLTGIGGVNCQRVLNSLGTITGRAGYAWNRALVYAKGGGALTNTTYFIQGDTFALALGTGTTSITSGGWTLGAGLEYAITNNLTTSFEYDHIGIGNATVPFHTLALNNAQNISVKQSIDVFKLGLNYKLPFVF